MASEKIKYTPFGDTIICRKIESKLKNSTKKSLIIGVDSSKDTKSTLLDFEHYPTLFEVVFANKKHPELEVGKRVVVEYRNKMHQPNVDPYPFLEVVHGGDEILYAFNAGYVQYIVD